MEPTQTETRSPFEWLTVDRVDTASQLDIIFHSTNYPCFPPLEEELSEERNAPLSYPPAISCYTFSFMMTQRDMGAYWTPPSWIIDNWEIFTVLLGRMGQLYLPSDKHLLLLWQGTKAITSCGANNLLVPPCVCVCVCDRPWFTCQMPSAISHVQD